MIEDNVKSRAEAAAQAELIIERGIEGYLKQILSLNAVTTLRAYRDKADTIRDHELQRALKLLEKGEPADAVLKTLARGITNKLTHAPSVKMKKASSEGRDELLALTQELFDLGEEDPL